MPLFKRKIDRHLFFALIISSGAISSTCAQEQSEEESAPIELEGPVLGSDADHENRSVNGDKADEDAPANARMAAGGRVLGEARAALRTKGCEAAAPAYRVAAGMGEGFEAAQHELGDCLLTITGRNETETALFRQEGMFWLNRAAFAGNARAQRRLAILHASPIGGAHDQELALSWSLVYGKNPEADLYGQGPLPSTMVEGLMNDLPDAAVVNAKEFAASFEPLVLQSYEPSERSGKDRGSFEDRREEFERRRRQGGRRGPGIDSN
ncbi:MAG: hypothetical protein GC152_00875 [Alphaproteobacteria bacterium]|nr:hypothetical protein [Alphaproteobacteria bacterium]